MSVHWSLLFCLSLWLSASRRISYLDRYIVFLPLLKDPNRVNFSDVQDEVNSHFQEFWKNICNYWKTEVKDAGIRCGKVEQYHRLTGTFFTVIIFLHKFHLPPLSCTKFRDRATPQQHSPKLSAQEEPHQDTSCSLIQHITLPKVKVLPCESGHLPQALEVTTKGAVILWLLCYSSNQFIQLHSRRPCEPTVRGVSTPHKHSTSSGITSCAQTTAHTSGWEIIHNSVPGVFSLSPFLGYRKVQTNNFY